ncbi:golgin subfamily A member 6-like protein 22 [Dendronephthya gigantea]|uniref:golgin subfamily A member 6-like protein 22 n=1 Tax=Dendronephthya gigantea TaxID=151771 RepID=UPI00106D05DE|nr:golgin subfamily A member 6-like protein 22 [Dendronephthya gigantea]
MSDCEDTVFVECADDVNDEREPSVEVLQCDSVNMRGEREDIVESIEAVKRVKKAIQYQDDESLQEALEKIKERPNIDAEFQDKIAELQKIKATENFADFHEVVEEVLRQLADAQEKAQTGKTSLSRPIEILNEVLPVFRKACASHIEKIQASPEVNKTLNELEKIRLDIKQCEKTDCGDVEKAKKLEKKGEKLLEEAVRHSILDVEKIEKRIKEEDEAGILIYFENTKKETNERMDFLTDDFVQMKNNCADDIQLTEQALDIEIQSKEHAFAKFEAKDRELEGQIEVQLEKEEELRKQLEKVQEERRALEEERELRGAMQDKANVVHKQAEDELRQLQANLNDLLVKVNTANVVLKQTKDVCNILFDKAVESKRLQNHDLQNVLLLVKRNRYNALLAQGVNYLNIQERESGTIDLLKDKIKKKKEKLHDFLKRRVESEAKKQSAKIKVMSEELEASVKNLKKVNEKLLGLQEDITILQSELGGTSYKTLKQAFADFKLINESEESFSLPSMPY